MTKKSRPTRRRTDALAALRAAAAENRAWRESIVAKLQKAKDKRAEKKRKELEENPPPPAPEPRWVHQHTGPTRSQRRAAQMSRGPLRLRRPHESKWPPLPSTSNVPYTNPDRDLKKARAAARRAVTR